jgi:hypothetical protein
MEHRKLTARVAVLPLAASYISEVVAFERGTAKHHLWNPPAI